MRELVWTTLLVGVLVPAAVSARMDGGAPDGGSYTQAQAVQGPGPTGPNDMGPPTGRSTAPNGNMGNVGRTGRDGATYDLAVVADATAIPDGGAPDGPPSKPPASGAEGTSGSEHDPPSTAPADPQAPTHTSSPGMEAPINGGPKSE